MSRAARRTSRCCRPSSTAGPAGDPASIARAAEALKSAKRPFIFAGGGVENADATQPLVRVAELLGAPVVTSVFGRGAISDRHPLALGDGWGRLNLYDELLTQADLVLVVGSRIDVVSDWNVGARFPQRIVQVDIDPLVVGQRRPVEVGIVGDAALVLDALAAQLGARPGRGHAGSTRRTSAAASRPRWWSAPGRCSKSIEDLRAALPDDTIFVDDLTLVGYWMPLLLDTYQPRTLIHPGTYGTLGYSLPAAIGAKLACPKQPVVSISGDGGFLFTMQELATASAAEPGPDRAGVQRQRVRCDPEVSGSLFGGRHIGSELKNPDFVKLGEAFGAKSAGRAEGSRGGGAARARGRRIVVDRNPVRARGIGEDGAVDAVKQQGGAARLTGGWRAHIASG